MTNFNIQNLTGVQLMNSKLKIVSKKILSASILLISVAHAETLECEFKVNKSGYESQKNFFPCRVEGCNELAYIKFNTPDSYLSIKNFIIDFDKQVIEYDWTTKKTERKINESKIPKYFFNNEPIDVESIGLETLEEFISYKKLKTIRKKENSKNVVYIYSENKNLLDFLKEDTYFHVKDKFDVVLNSEIHMNKSTQNHVKRLHFTSMETEWNEDKTLNIITLYGNNKISWIQDYLLKSDPLSPVLYDNSIGFGDCKPIK
jgi:hypothetical protein